MKQNKLFVIWKNYGDRIEMVEMVVIKETEKKYWIDGRPSAIGCRAAVDKRPDGSPQGAVGRTREEAVQRWLVQANRGREAAMSNLRDLEANIKVVESMVPTPVS